MIRKLLRLGLLGLLMALVTGIAVFYYANRPVKDFSKLKTENVFAVGELTQLAEHDSASMSGLSGKLVGVHGRISKMDGNDSVLSIELGLEGSGSSVICQADTRHILDFEQLHTGDSVNLQGILTAFSTDTELGLGTTVEMNYCTLIK